MSSDQQYSINPSTGTTTPIFVPTTASPKTIAIGKSYFWIGIKSSQAYFSDDGFLESTLGISLDKVKNLVVTSSVGLDTPLLDGTVRGIQRTREMKKGTPVQLGLSPLLVKLVPATMTQVSISLDYIVDKENRLRQLSDLINVDSFLAPLSLAPGASLMAKTIGTLAQGVIQAFIPAAEQKPVLQFSGEFSLAGGIKEGYYVILGSRSKNEPLPSPASRLTVDGAALLVDGRPFPKLSYVILELRMAEARGRDAGANTPWHAKLMEAEREAQLAGDDPYLSEDSRKLAWSKVEGLIRDAGALLHSDTNYLPKEAESIRLQAFEKCRRLLFPPPDKRASGSKELSIWMPDEAQSRAAAGIAQDVDIDAELRRYLRQVTSSRDSVPKEAL